MEHELWRDFLMYVWFVLYVWENELHEVSTSDALTKELSMRSSNSRYTERVINYEVCFTLEARCMNSVELSFTETTLLLLFTKGRSLLTGRRGVMSVLRGELGKSKIHLQNRRRFHHVSIQWHIWTEMNRRKGSYDIRKGLWRMNL